jgi:hypothetical protein
MCFGMNDQEKEVQKWHIIDKHDFYDGFDHSNKKVIPGKLQIYYARNYHDIYESAARFIPDDDSEGIIKFEHLSEIDAEYYKRYSRSKGYFERFRKINVSVLMYIERSIDGKNFTKYLRAIVEQCNEPEELLDIPKFELRINGDNIEIEDRQKRKYKIYNQGHISNIKHTLSLNKPFRLTFFEDKTFVQGKVISYTNGSPIWWDGWIPSLKLLGIGMSTDLSVVDKRQPVPVYIDLDREKKQLPHYQRIKLLERGLMAATAVAMLMLYYNKLNC